MQLCEQEDGGRYLECVKMLIGVVEPNRPDNDGYTAVTYAVTQRNKDRLLAILNSSSGKCINLDVSTADGGHTARSAINKFYPEMSERLHQNPEFPKVILQLIYLFRMYQSFFCEENISSSKSLIVLKTSV